MRRVADRVEDGLGAFAARSLFQYWAVNGRAMPDTSIATPVTRAIARPYGVTFSSSTNTLIAATHSSAISIQQHPTQNAPCLSPILKAPAAPSRHSVMKKPIGERHWLKHACLSGVN